MRSQHARRKGTNLTLDPELIAECKAAGLNLSEIAEEAIRAELRRHKECQWLKDNQEAIAEFNRRIGERGLFNDDLRQF